ncbi:MAG TPA: lasso peptide biosynthesis B2 protein [Vicinamibacterales bacterium]|nr:lasso peptide biosynthesis B2 protein [Vicinamibacterales bacterium]
MLSEYLCAIRVGWWMWWSAAMVRWCSLPGLCREASLHARLSTPRLDPARVAAIVSRVSRLPLFSLPIFPRACMRQSLALYRELTRMGYPAAIHFGVHRAGAGLSGHSWVTLDGVPISESHSLEQLTITYSHSARWSSP